MFTCVTNVKSKVNKVKGAWLDQHKKNSLPILLYTPPPYLYPPSPVIDRSRDETERSATKDIS